MPQRRSQSSKAFGPGTIILLVVLGLVYFFQVYQKNQSGAPLPPALATPTLAALTTAGLPAASDTAAPAATAETASADIATADSAAAPGDQSILAPTTTGSSAGESIQVWFSDPLARKTTGGPETNLVAAINGAKVSIDMAIYNLTLPNVGNALLQARQRGVPVRLVMESESMDKDIPRRLQNAGVPIVGDQKESLMHNKFTIIDGQEVWTGSMNYSSNSAYTDFNNLLRIRSAKLVQDYQVYFNQMFVDHRFSSDKQPTTPYPQVTVAGIPVEVYFSPEDGGASHIIAALKTAQKSIDILAYSFTSNDIAYAIDAMGRKGIKVRGVFDESQYQNNIGGDFDLLKKRGYDVHLDGIPGLQHNKVFIIDSQGVITGSYNFTVSAERFNDENLVIIHDAGIAAQYLQQFDKAYQSAKK